MGRLVEAVGAVWRQLRPRRQLEGLRAAVRMGASAVGQKVAGVLLRSRGRGHDELSGHCESVVWGLLILSRIIVVGRVIRGHVRGVSWSEFKWTWMAGGWQVDVSCLVSCRVEDGFWSQRAFVARYAAKDGRRETKAR